MGIISLKKSNKENVMAVARISAEVLTTLKENNINISKTIRDYLTSIAADLRTPRVKRKSS